MRPTLSRTLTFAAAATLSAAAAGAQSAPTTTATTTTTTTTTVATTVTAPAVGSPAPDFTMPWADASGARATPVALSSLKGKVVVLAFYPKDRTSGCTAEMTKFRDEFASLFGGDGVVVVPVSADDLASHQSWATDMKFPFALASDPQLAVADKYGSHVAGRPFANRTVFVIGKDGRIAWSDLKFNALSEPAYDALKGAVAAAR